MMIGSADGQRLDPRAAIAIPYRELHEIADARATPWASYGTASRHRGPLRGLKKRKQS